MNVIKFVGSATFRILIMTPKKEKLFGFEKPLINCCPFQVVDMRWGVRDEATDDHMTTELCMREIKNCQRLSMGPNFVVILEVKDVENLFINIDNINHQTNSGISRSKIRIPSHSNVHTVVGTATVKG